MDPSLLALVRCPSCRRPGLEGGMRGARCPHCGFLIEAHDGYLDLLDRGTAEFPPHTAEQRFMESELVARVYDRFWRPTFVRVMAGRGAGASAGGFAGELFIHKNSLAMEDRSGPWLDLSCGTGLFTRAMAAAAPGELVIGIDISGAMLEVAARRAKGYANVGLIRADAHELPLIEAAFGGVNHAGALHAYDDPTQAFREILRVLKPGGVYVASTYARSKSMLGRLAASVAGIRRFDPHELRAQLSRIGFADYDEVRFGDVFIFRVRKP